jgi:hypothetical protein
VAIHIIDLCSRNNLAILLSHICSLLSRLNSVLVPVLVRHEYGEIIYKMDETWLNQGSVLNGFFTLF